MFIFFNLLAFEFEISTKKFQMAENHIQTTLHISLEASIGENLLFKK